MPEIKDKNKGLPPPVTVKAVYMNEGHPPKGIKGMERFPVTGGEAESPEAARETG